MTIRGVSSILILTLLINCATVYASTTITAQVVRNQAGTGETFISSGFPFPPGLVTESTITSGSIKVVVDSTEVAANVTALRGRHSDGSIRSALIQFTMASMAQDDVLTASVIVDDGVRTYSDPAYQRPTATTVSNNNVILPTNPSYLVSTRITFQNLLPTGDGTTEEEKQYTTLADDRFDWLVTNQEEGTARYEKGRAMLTLWARTGNAKYFNEAISGTLDWLSYNTPGPTCTAAPYVNPDGRGYDYESCGLPAEHLGPVAFSYASAYLLTGYRDFWSTVAYLAQYNQRNITNQATANTYTIQYGQYDAPRYNYTHRYGFLLAATMIEATMPISGNYFTAKQLTWSDNLSWALNAIEGAEWDLKWIPFNNGSGTVPAVGTTISQGGVTAELAGVYSRGMYDYPTPAGDVMPATGYIQISSLAGGSFSSGALTGISASATGAEESDYRQGYVGTLSNSPRPSSVAESSQDLYLPIFQSIFPLNFLIDYYLNVEADSRIPAIVKTNLDIIINNQSLLDSNDWAYQADGDIWGDPIWGNPYELRNPVSTHANPNSGKVKSPWELPEYARMVAFVLKTLGTDTVNGATYETWYSRFIDTANNSPVSVLSWQWKLFGQFYGFGADTPWMMSQASLPSTVTFREPAYYASIPGNSPDLYRLGGQGSFGAGSAVFTSGSGSCQ